MRRQFLAMVFAALLLAPVGKAWTWPATGAVLQPFLFDPAHPYASGQHRGLDVGAELGAVALAPAAGTVTFAGTVPTSGKSVTITTADGYAVTLTHLGSITVERGAPVAEGDGVGTIGLSGEPEVPQPYVHVGVRIAAEPQGYLDPLAFLPARVPETGALVPPVTVAEPPSAPGVAEPTPAPVADPVPAAPSSNPAAPVGEPARAGAADSVADPAPAALPAVTRRAPTPVAEPAPVPAAPLSAPAAEALPVEAARAAPEPAAAPVRGPATAAPAEQVAGPTTQRAPKNRSHALRADRIADRVAADARDRTHARRPAPVHATAYAATAPTAPVANVGRRPDPRRVGVLLLVLSAAALLAAAVRARAQGAVRMMVRCGADTEEDPGRSGLAVRGRSPSPRSRGGLRRPVGRFRPLSPAEGQRRPHGEWHGRARNAGDGGRRQGGQVLR